MDVGSIDGGEYCSSLLEDEDFQKRGKDLKGRIISYRHDSDSLEPCIKILMSRPDRTEAKVEGSYDRDRGGTIEGSITWTWETQVEKEDCSSARETSENSNQNINYKDEN
jgi:hypothetical protein